MGCEVSNLRGIEVQGSDTCSGEGQLQLDYHKFVQSQRGDVLQLYHFSKIIHRSATAIIRRVIERNSRLNRVCKIIPIDRNANFDNFKEPEVLKRLNHPNIVQIVEYFPEKAFIYIILEEIQGQSLMDFYFEQETHSFYVILEIMRQILIALAFCHSKGYAHVAINPQNIMIVKLGDDKYLVKLVGFGDAVSIGAKLKSKTSRMFGEDSIFKPPEGQNAYVDKIDIWSCGIIFLELITGERKFDNFIPKKDEIIEEAVEQLSLSEEVKSLLQEFINQLLEFKPENRISAFDALQHNLFKADLGQKTLNMKVNQNKEIINKLLKFKIESNLKSLFAIYASLNILSLNEKNENLLEFYSLDKNKDGKLDFDELVEALQNCYSMTKQEAVRNVDKIFEKVDKNHSKSIQYYEYVMATSSVTKEFSEKSLEQMFKQIDLNSDGIISSDELNKAIDGIEDYHLLKNRKNQINFCEFKDLMFDIFDKNVRVVYER